MLQPSQARMLAWLNISSIGMLDAFVEIAASSLIGSSDPKLRIVE